MASIIEQVRQQAIDETDAKWKAHNQQIAMLSDDGSYEDGWEAAVSAQPRRLRWFLFGFFVNASLYAFLHLPDCLL